MSDPITSALDMIGRQIKELDAIVKQGTEDLNTVAATERMARWKLRTVPLIAEYMGPKEAKRFADTHTGPSFTNDLLEELTDDAEVYRNFLVSLAAEIKKRPDDLVPPLDPSHQR
ncbi:MAG TPA: hypothetical protein VFL31_00305 [Nitrospiraceae bacterium]|nr:hypothetical protein [Nitrospiraceae bacterium]